MHTTVSMAYASRVGAPTSRRRPHTLPTNSTSFPSGFQWHHAAHEKWGDETLWFSLLSFEPVYKRDRATQNLRDALATMGVRSYVIYELTGQYDLLVRAWVHSSAGNSYEEGIEAVLRHGNGSAFSARVSKVVHHWVWQETERSSVGTMRQPEAAVLEYKPSRRELELMNTAQRELLAGTELSELSDEQQTQLTKFQADRLITDPPYEAGIKFIVQVKVADEPAQKPEQREALQDQICDALDAAQGVIWDRSLYYCRGHIQFIILGRVRLASSVDPSLGQAGPFHEITPRLLDQISKIAAAGGTKTYTNFFPLPGLLAFQDEISVPPEPRHRRPDFAALFKTEESHQFEAKCSAFSAVDQWLKGKGDVITSTETSHTPVHSLLFAVTSLLNDGGGAVLLGAAEPGIFGGTERGKKLPRVGKYLCLGLDPDLQNGTFDSFSRTLTQLLKERISPNPEQWFRIWNEEVEGRTVVAITVEFPDEWFWVHIGKADPKFVVRRGAATSVLKAREITEHQERHPRRNGNG